MSRIPQETIDRINDSADIVDVVSKSVELKKRGRNFFGLCPFHEEKTPSFSVAPDKGIYHCFGCGKGGNAVNFIIENEKLSFVEAIQQLGQHLGLPVEFSGSNESNNLFDNLYKIHEDASALYHETLLSDRGEKALKYLTDRGISIESIKLFKIGFAPESSKFLFNAIKSNGFDKEVFEKSGLFGYSRSEFFDRFRSRIMFPIWNASGKIVGFGGRVFASDDPAKYMNSPETPLYKKSDIFYGLNHARDSIRKNGYAVLVEGYTDVIQLHQNGITNCVAVSGTAFSERHVNQMKKFCTKALLAYDGDSAGISATLKTGYSLIKGGIDAQVIEIPNKLDPDEWISSKGPEVFIKEGVDRASGLVDYHLKSSHFTEKSPSEKSNIATQILNEVREITNPIISNEIVRKIAEASNVEEHEIKRMIPKKARVLNNNQPQEEEKDSFDTVNDKAAIGLIKVLLHGASEPIAWIQANLDLNNISSNRLKQLIENLVSTAYSSSSEIIASLPGEKDRKIITELMMEEGSSIDFMQMSIECIET
ncbi:MAG: DNA primase, partial [Candidatus Neomarinimicrobiota bacterium]|nr:DNA primase [Candidatus Neomarinimicrobiota bacterium]